MRETISDAVIKLMESNFVVSTNVPSMDWKNLGAEEMMWAIIY